MHDKASSARKIDKKFKSFVTAKIFLNENNDFFRHCQSLVQPSKS